MPTIVAGDLETNFDELGSGNAGVVLLLHGWPDDASTWAVIAPALAASGWRVIVPTCGASDERDSRVTQRPEPPAKFSDPFVMVGLRGVRHFSQREAPAAVADLLVAFFAGARP